MESFLQKGIKAFTVKATRGVAKALDSVPRNNALVLFQDPTDLVYNKWERLPPQAFYTSEIATKILNALELGMSKAAAIAMGKVPEKIVKKWLWLGMNGIDPFDEFYTNWNYSIAVAEMNALLSLRSADPGEAAKFELLNGVGRDRFGTPRKEEKAAPKSEPQMIFQNILQTVKEDTNNSLIQKMIANGDVIDG